MRRQDDTETLQDVDLIMPELVQIQTADGKCPTWVFTPNTLGGPWPSSIVCMDALGIRPGLNEMAQRLADAGFVVALPDLFYRAGPYGPLEPHAVFSGPDVRATLAPLMDTTDNQKAAADIGPVLKHLEQRHDVTGSTVGVVGYCMGGAIALTIAATSPERIGAVASFHGGQLATDSELSPHLLADRIRARVYIGAADTDKSYPSEMAALLVRSLMDAHVDHHHELYAGADHGWTMTDFPVYHHVAAERHWRRLVGLFRSTLDNNVEDRA
jgi:carboxymethylenebutenolidase